MRTGNGKQNGGPVFEACEERMLMSGSVTGLATGALASIPTGNSAIVVQLNPTETATRSAANSLVAGGIVDGRIDGVNVVKKYTFRASAGNAIELTTSGYAIDSGFTASFSLYAPSGALVDSWTSNSTRLRTPALRETGQYTLRVNDGRQTRRGSYSIGLESYSPVSPNPLALNAGGIVDGNIDRGLDIKQYVFSATAGDGIELITNGYAIDSGYTASFRLIAPSGAVVDSWTSNSPRLRTPTLRETGQYMVQVNDGNLSRRGAYSIGLESYRPVSPGAMGLANNAVTAGSIDRPLDAKQFTFRASAGAVIDLYTTGRAITSGFTASFTLFAPSGAVVDTWTSNSSRHRTETLRETGQYMLQVNDGNLKSTGAFTIQAIGIR